jgi:hypothetical protein
VARTVKEQIGVDLPEYEEQEVVAPEAAEEPAAEEPSVPDWVPEKFRKNPEAFASSYASLENELRQRGEREKEMRDELDQLQAWAAQAQAQPQYDQADPLAAYAAELEAARDNGDTLREAQLQSWLNQYSISQALGQQQVWQQQQQAPQLQAQNELLAVQAKETMARRHSDDWDDVEPRIAELLQSDPDLLSERALGSLAGTVGALERAYQLVKAEDWRKQVEDMQQAGISQADLDRARKLQAQTMSGSSGRPDQPSAADALLAEMRQGLEGSASRLFRAS